MGRPCNVTNTEAVLLIQKYIHYFETNNFLPCTAQVWKDMSKDLNGRWKPHSVYTHIRGNKNGNLETARQNLGINISYSRSMISFIENDVSDEVSEDTSDKSSYNDDEDDDRNVHSFFLVLSPTEWD